MYSYAFAFGEGNPFIGTSYFIALDLPEDQLSFMFFQVRSYFQRETQFQLIGFFAGHLCNHLCHNNFWRNFWEVGDHGLYNIFSHCDGSDLPYTGNKESPVILFIMKKRILSWSFNFRLTGCGVPMVFSAIMGTMTLPGAGSSTLQEEFAH